MKRIIFTLAFTAMIIALKAQSGNTIAQPDQAIGRRINSSGQVTNEYTGIFSYFMDGKLNGLQIQDYDRSQSFSYDGDFLTGIYSTHPEGYWQRTIYTYEDGRLKMNNSYDSEGENQYKICTYQGDGRLARVDYASGWSSNTNAYSLFEYENGGRTRVESYHHKVLQDHHWVWGITRLTTRQYNDTYALVSEQNDTYNVYGEFTETNRTLFTYTPNGAPETEIKQTLNDDEWVNSSIHIYIYDEDDRIVEQQDGIWSEELSDWDINKKTIHEFSDDGLVYTVSFYKKSGDDWVWDVFKYQKVFFDPELKNQQSALSTFAFIIEGVGSFNINQFEFHMVYTERPTYMKVGEDSAPVCAVYPNPGNGQVRIEAPTEDCVVRFYDLNGRLILAKPFDFATDVATDHWTPGLYLWEIWNGTQRQASGKWVKE